MESPSKEAARPHKDAPRDFLSVKMSNGNRIFLVPDASGQFDKELIKSLAAPTAPKLKK